MTTDPFMEAARLGARSSTLIEYEEIPHLPRQFSRNYLSPVRYDHALVVLRDHHDATTHGAQVPVNGNGVTVP